uniref:Uncharacterized protein n=1 Tax=Nelumbo nucifera TaxID=4432 RepID=A0A822ZAW8_NELNU|nr:TPA_asm: hypothetical protein HUJ06_014918 [Nelumbo nucifera]
MAVPSSLLRSSNPRRFILPSSLNLNSHPPTSLWCLSKAGANGHKGISNNGERKSKVATKASTASESVVSSQPQTSSGAHLSSMVADVKLVLFRILEPAVKVKRKSWKLQAEMLIEKVILDCRFFSLLAVMGSLVGSILCFVEVKYFPLQKKLIDFPKPFENVNPSYYDKDFYSDVSIAGLLPCSGIIFPVFLQYVQKSR